MTPTLIIGLGGAGIRVATRIYKKFLEYNPTIEEKQRFICLCFDTDETDIIRAKETLPSEWVVNISSDQSIQAMYNQLKGGSSVQDWFDEGIAPLYETRLNTSSPMCRQTARLALLEAEATGKLSVIDRSIAQLKNLTQYGCVNVKIVCSLAGGTGAGTFLQIAYYVKEVLMKQGINSQEITGYFLLADAFREVCPNVTQIDAMRANTYASLKELNTFISRDFLSGSPVEFEYRYGQDNKSLPPYPPYDLCYVTGYDPTQNCFNKLGDFMFYTAADPLGQTYRSWMMEDIRSLIQSSDKRYASFGLSKMVYPVDDLFEYFSLRRLSEMLTTWQWIDKDFQDKYKEYQDKKRDGIPTQEPQKGMHYMCTLEDLAHQQGSTGAEFREIYKSTQILNWENLPSGKSKAQEYFETIEIFVNHIVKYNPTLNESYTRCTASHDFLTDDNPENDFQFVFSRERDLDDYKKEVVLYINNLKRLSQKQCFFDDLENENYVSQTPEQDQHHLNTFILPKDEELHPIAVRYFLYELQDLIKPSLAKLKEENKRLWDAIEEYVEYFDDPDTRQFENAVESLERSRENMNLFQRLMGKRPYKDAKERYFAVSRQQAENLRKYTFEKLLEETFSSMLDNINRLLEESEKFFNQLPEWQKEIENKCESLLKKHDGVSDINTTYVLASEQIKKDLYDFVISRADAYLFPSVTSAALYRTMYYNVCKDLGNALHSIPKLIDKEAQERATFESYKKIIAECVSCMDKRIRESNNDYATKNVIEALREEAIACTNDSSQTMTYMRKKIVTLKNKAHICDLDNYKSDYRFKNVWGTHPGNVEQRVITQYELHDLFNDTQTDINPEAAEMFVSGFFSPFEIVRINTAFRLPVSQFEVSRSAYDSFVNKSNFTPHLDKRWGETDIFDEAFGLT